MFYRQKLKKRFGKLKITNYIDNCSFAVTSKIRDCIKDAFALFKVNI